MTFTRNHAKFKYFVSLRSISINMVYDVLGINRVGTSCKIQNEFNVNNITKTNTDDCWHTPSALLSAKAEGMGHKWMFKLLKYIILLNQVKRQKHLVDSNDVDGMLIHFMCINA